MGPQAWCLRHGRPHMLLWYVTNPRNRNTEASIRARFVRAQSGPIINGMRCLLWDGYCNPITGYGQVQFGGRLRTVHTLAWEWEHGPAEQQVNHHCDVRYCVELLHLYVGTQADNMRDMVQKGRNSNGTDRVRLYEPRRIFDHFRK